MSFNTTASPVKATANKVRIVAGIWKGGGAATDCSKPAASTGFATKGITSVKYNAATGKYRVTFDAVGEYLIGAHIQILTAAGTAAGSRVANITAYSRANRTMDFVVSDLATPTLADLGTSDYVMVTTVFADTDTP